MTRLHFILPAAAALALTAFAPRVFALAASPRNNSKPPVKYTTTQKTVNLSPITVHGTHIPLPLALQLYKKALTRHWSNKRADLDKLVCQWQTPLGTHMQSLWCMTNRNHQKLAEQTQTAMLSANYAFNPARGEGNPLAMALANGAIPISLGGASRGGKLQRGTLAPLLNKLPPANASYTFRVTGNNGKPLVDYVIKHGNLTHIYRYVYKGAAKSSKKP
jgi:hypothetical protein